MTEVWIFVLSALGSAGALSLAVRWWPRRIPKGHSVHESRRRIEEDDRSDDAPDRWNESGR
ncbi:hypothetical protein [Nocardia sp. BMG51109]|uniref:hypothetical protein n=1 Tax=Nocardia sp. BMG51109 TaxID=1056816 RepID=UPI0004665A47|nr:hypothetical protein [Nocardia sp. BMG51109]